MTPHVGWTDDMGHSERKAAAQVWIRHFKAICTRVPGICRVEPSIIKKKKVKEKKAGDRMTSGDDGATYYILASLQLTTTGGNVVRSIKR